MFLGKNYPTFSSVIKNIIKAFVESNVPPISTIYSLLGCMDLLILPRNAKYNPNTSMHNVPAGTAGGDLKGGYT